MKKDKILNPKIISEIAAIGHTQYFVIADAGLPIPQGVPVVDISLVKGVPTFVQTLEAVSSELVVESYILAEEISDVNSSVKTSIGAIMNGLPSVYVPHADFKILTEKASVIIRTGETSSFANIILVAGVNF